MCQKQLIICLFIFLIGNLLYAQPSQTTIKVEGNGFEKRVFVNAAVIFTNRTYTIENIVGDFTGFEFLASEGKVTNKGIIIPETDGLIYIIAPSGEVEGWTIVENSEFSYSDGNHTKLSIFQHEAKANTPIEIPLITSFPGASPLAKTIHYNENTLYVKGNLIDILNANGENYVFPQNTTFKFPSTIPSYIAGEKYAVSLVEYSGVSQVSANEACEIVVATHYNTVNIPGWVFSGDYFQISSVRNYYIYKYQYNTPGQWIDIPQPKSSGTVAPTLVFGSKLTWVNPQTLPGTVITKSLDPKNVYITNPSITILPDGDYLAACTGALRFLGGSSGVTFFLSKDKGNTWQVQSANNGLMSYQNLFVHNGQLYVMGTNAPSGDIIIRKSDDNGITWTYPTAEGQDGWLNTGSYHTAPVPMVVHNDRIWRAFEKNGSGGREAFVMSAPVNSDLMKSSSWTYTNSLPYETNWITGDGKSFGQWIEGNVVVDRTGNIVDILRVDEIVYGGVAAITNVVGLNTISFDPLKDIISFPGGGKKFTIRYDEVSDKYWAISNAVFDEDRNKTHNGIYKNGIHCGLLRNRLVLMYSDNLRDWTVKDTLISSENPFFHGFQYIDWQYEGNDIIAVSRTAFEDEDGLPVRQHDANYFLFHRFKDFRKNIVSSSISYSNETDCIIKNFNRQIEITGKDINVFDISIYDITGRVKYSKFKSTSKTISTINWRPGLYIVNVNSKGKLYTQKILVYD